MAASPGLAMPRATPPWRQRLDAFWRWWRGELTAFARERFGRVMSADAPIVVVDNGALVLLESRAGHLEESARLPIESLDADGRRRVMRELLARAGEEQQRVRVCLPRGEALVRRVRLPLATEENLGQVLAFEMDRLTPFAADDVYFGHRVAARDAAADKIEVELAVARRDIVDARIAQVADMGANVQGVVIEDDAARSSDPLDLMPETRRAARTSGPEVVIAKQLLGVAIVALLLLALGLPLWQKRETVVALHPVVAKAKQDAEATDVLARDVEKLANDYNFLLAKKHSNRPVLAFVEEISRLLPDNTWVQQLDVRSTQKTREVQISGETTSASKLIEILEESKLVQNAATKGTVSRGAQPGTERFVIVAEARPTTPPERVAITSVPVAPPTTRTAGPVPGAPIPLAPMLPPSPPAKAAAAPKAPDAAKPAEPKPATAEVKPVPPPEARTTPPQGMGR